MRDIERRLAAARAAGELNDLEILDASTEGFSRKPTHRRPPQRQPPDTGPGGSKSRRGRETRVAREMRERKYRELQMTLNKTQMQAGLQSAMSE